MGKQFLKSQLCETNRLCFNHLFFWLHSAAECNRKKPRQMNFFKRLKLGLSLLNHSSVRRDPDKFGHFGARATLGVPCDLKKPRNIYIYEHSRIGPKANIMTMGESKFIMKRESEFAEGLVVVTSNHKQSVGVFRESNNADNVYRDIIVEEDVWGGINVTLLCGAHIGRGCIIGAGAVVRRKVPPYAVLVGNPARIVKFKYSVDDIIHHEQALYAEDDRIPRKELERNLREWEANPDKLY